MRIREIPWIASQAKWGQVFAGHVPFPGENHIAGVFSMLKGRRPGRPDNHELSNRVWKVIKSCWEGNPARRMTMAEVITVLEAEVRSKRS